MSTLGKNIKSLRKIEKLNQKDLAFKIGVSQTSIAHYEAGTRQPTIETLMELSQLFDVSIDHLVGHSLSTIKNVKGEKVPVDQLIEMFVKFLINKDEVGFTELFETMVLPNYNLNELLDSILKRVMYRIGDLWETGEITEADEHYATNIVRKSLYYTNYNMKKALKNKKAISLIVGSEKHSLGIEMVNTVLESEGVAPIYLGGNLPIRSIEKAIRDNEPNYIFISVTLQDNFNNLVQLVDYINDRFKGKMEICIGGQGIKEYKDSKNYKNVHILNDIDEVKEFLLKD